MRRSSESTESSNDGGEKKTNDASNRRGDTDEKASRRTATSTPSAQDTSVTRAQMSSPSVSHASSTSDSSDDEEGLTSSPTRGNGNAVPSSGTSTTAHSSGNPSDGSASPSTAVVVTPQESFGVSRRARAIRRGISTVSWGTATLVSAAAAIAGVPIDTMFLLMFTGIGYAGSEVGGSLVMDRLRRLEGGDLIRWAERIGGISFANNIGDAIALRVIGYSLGTRHPMPTSIANAAQRRQIQDRGVQFLALISAICCGGIGYANAGMTVEVAVSALATFTTIATGGTGYLAVTTHGARVYRRSIPRISNMVDPVARDARIMRGSLYAPTTIGDFFCVCGAVGGPLLKAGFMLPFGLLARVLPQSAKNIVMGFVGFDVITDIQEAWICSQLLADGVPPEHVEDVAEKKTWKYKALWTFIYSLVPFFIVFIPYVFCHYYYSLNFSTEIVAGVSVLYEGVLLLFIGCNFERINHCVTAPFLRCLGVCKREDDYAFVAQMSSDSTAGAPSQAVGPRDATAASLGSDVGTTSATINIGVLGSTVPGSTRIDTGRSNIGLQRASGGSRSSRAEDDREEAAPAPTRVPIGSGSALDAAAVTAVIAGLRMSNIGTTRQGRNVFVLDPGQSSSQRNLQQAIDLDKADKLLFVVDPLDKREFYLHLADVVRSRDASGVNINLDNVDISFDRHHGLTVDEEAFTTALQELILTPVGVTGQRRVVYVIVPGQTSTDRYVRRLLQLERSGGRHCFIADADTGQTAYCSAEEIFGVLNPDEFVVRGNINKADRVFDEKIRQTQHSREGGQRIEELDDDGNPVGQSERGTRDPFVVEAGALPDDMHRENRGVGVFLDVPASSCPFDTGSTTTTRLQRVRSTMASAVAGVFSILSRKKPASSREPFEESDDEMDRRPPPAGTIATTAAAVVVPASTAYESNDGEEGEYARRNTLDDDGASGGNGDSDVYNSDESNGEEAHNKQINWFYDDRQMINGNNGIDLGVFQDKEPNEKELKLPDMEQKLLKPYNKEYEESKKARAEIEKKLEEMSQVKNLYSSEEDDEDQEDKTDQERMLEDFMGSSTRIMPKKYDIPDDVKIVPPQTTTFTSWLPETPAIPIWGDISSYFTQASKGGGLPLMYFASYRLEQEIGKGFLGTNGLGSFIGNQDIKDTLGIGGMNNDVGAAV